MATKSHADRVAALRRGLEAQQRGMGSGRMISNKGFTKMNLRIIPIPASEDVPGYPYRSIFCRSLGKKGNGTTSPSTFGLKCPVMDFYSKVMDHGDKEDKEFVRKVCHLSREYWMGVWDRDDMGAPGSNSIRILRAKRTVYERIIKYMLDTDNNNGVEDITDPVDGRDIRVRKEGQQLDTEWSVKVLDQSPISEDEDELAAYVEEAASFDPRKFFYKVDLDVLQQIYQNLTGDEIPDSYIEQIADVCRDSSDDDTPSTKVSVRMAGGTGDEEESEDESDAGSEAEDEDEEGGDEEESDAEDEDEEGGDEDEAGEDENAEPEIEFGTTRGQFENNGTTVEGTIMEQTTDEDGDDVYAVLEDGDEQPWHVPVADVTVVVLEEEEPKEVAPTVEKKPAKKPSAKKTTKKAATKKAGVKKPGGKKGAPNKPKSAVSGLKARLGKNKKK